MRYVFSCGGTAGHINPAIAIADRLRELDTEAEIVFIGKEGGMEQRLVQRAGYPILSLDVMGIKRSLSVSNVKAVFKAFAATRKSEKLLLSLQPDAVIGTGGYVCYPVMKAAAKMGIYTVLHESNAVPGLAVRLLKRRVSKIFVSFDKCKERLKGAKCCEVSGNPVSGFEKLSREEARRELGIDGRYKYLIVSFGGSLGAKTVNGCALKIMEELTAKRGDIRHFHSYGRGEAECFCKAFTEKGLDKCKDITASEYIYCMPTLLKAADVVFCRSGAMTLAEIAASGVASVLIPSPNVTANHQLENALALSSKNAAFTVNEKTENAEKQALHYVSELIRNEALRNEMARNAALFGSADAADLIANDIINNCKNKKN